MRVKMLLLLKKKRESKNFREREGQGPTYLSEELRFREESRTPSSKNLFYLLASRNNFLLKANKSQTSLSK